jgi:hypothetical protein
MAIDPRGDGERAFIGRVLMAVRLPRYSVFREFHRIGLDRVSSRHLVTNGTAHSAGGSSRAYADDVDDSYLVSIQLWQADVSVSVLVMSPYVFDGVRCDMAEFDIIARYFTY